ncbi:MAG: hypothetical protein IIU26_04565, partial [Clostridium sp.]|nr:hypothetical protein [Clostridium sp.]
MKEIKIDGLSPEEQEEELNLITDEFGDSGERRPRSRAKQVRKAPPENAPAKKAAAEETPADVELPVWMEKPKREVAWRSEPGSRK